MHGLKLKPSKCEFFQEQIEYLGHSVLLKGVWPKRVEGNCQVSQINDVYHHQRFHRAGWALLTRIDDPLHEYACGDTTKKKKESAVLNEAARNAFHQLKKVVMNAPVLASPDSNKEYLLETDASKLGLEAVLSQKQSDGRYHPVAFWE